VTPREWHIRNRLTEARTWWRITRGVCRTGSRVRLAFVAFAARPAQRLFGEPIAINLIGTATPIFLRTTTTDKHVFVQVFIDREYDLDYGTTSPKTIVDAGANIGLTAVFFALNYPDSRILALEPEAGNFAVLELNAETYPNISPIRAALWHESGAVELHDPGEGEWAFRVRTPSRRDQQQSAIHVAAMTVKELLAAYGRIDLLKLDIEGAERNVLLHAAEWIDDIGAIVAELHPGFNDDCHEIFDLATVGFATRAENGELFLARR